MCEEQVCKYCARVINRVRCTERRRHTLVERKVTCSNCIQKVYRKREKVDKLLRLLW